MSTNRLASAADPDQMMHRVRWDSGHSSWFAEAGAVDDTIDQMKIAYPGTLHWRESRPITEILKPAETLPW